ncbi:MAG: methyltransferase domain-containing protein, partial [Leptospiraceae bacterium]|nr:methyltransferase domain-containing protein [Leptospiraceae bacterium]
MSNKEFWNERYSLEEYVYGESPNIYFKEKLDSLPKGKILLPCEGEGRNAVHAAQKGFEVFAFDQSEVAQKKAFKLANKYGVKINYDVYEMESANYKEQSFDVLGLIFAHFPK